jgi:precorrin-6A/cobalt-precorrin-6A reductase
MILVLGGTAEARSLAQALDDGGLDVITSLAGRVSNPRLPLGQVRIGGFGGPEALGRWLSDNGVTCVIDATHPFAARISASAAHACAIASVPLLRLERPAWSPRPGDRWTRVTDLESAAALTAGNHRAFLTTGRQGLEAFATVANSWFLIRCVDPPEPPLPPHYELLLDRGPYTLEGELELIDRHRIDLIVTKDSGGAMTEAKLDAARERGLPVVVVERPSRPDVETVETVREAISWVHTRDTGAVCTPVRQERSS